MSVEEENKAIARRFVEVLQEFFRTGDPDLMDSVLDDNVVQHISGQPPEAQSLEGFKRLLPALPQAFPNVLFEVEDLLAEGDKVAFRLNWTATHRGEFFGIPPTGARATVTEMHMFRIADGKVVERWGEWDALGLMQQLGAFPAPEQSEEASPT
jgi:predicted ester cyclase